MPTNDPPTGREYTRLINGMNQRMEAAFLLLRICPQCGANLMLTGLSALWCPKHEIVCTRTKMELWNQLDPSMGAITEG